MNKMIRQLLPFGTLTLIICILSALKPDIFLTSENILNVLSRSSVNGIIAVGMTLVIISAGIDLSVGSMLALVGMCAGGIMVMIPELAQNDSGGVFNSMLQWMVDNPTSILLTGSLAGILVGFLCGCLNGTLITKLKLPPFIVTLGTMSAFRGVSYVMNAGKPFDVPSYTFLGSGLVPLYKTLEKTVLTTAGKLEKEVLEVLTPWSSVDPQNLEEGARVVSHGIPVCIILFAVIVVIAGFVLKFTRLGRYTYAIGSNRQAAFHAGINVDKTLIAIYTLTGLVVAIGALIATSRTVSAQPTAGITLELDIIAAVVIGGASLSGGRGTITGTIIGTLLISFLRNGCTLLGISTNIQLIVIGAIIITAVALDQMARSKAQTTKS